MLTEKTLTSIREDLHDYDEGEEMPIGVNDVADLVNEIDRNRIALKQREDLLDQIALAESVEVSNQEFMRIAIITAYEWRELRTK